MIIFFSNVVDVVRAPSTSTSTRWSRPTWPSTNLTCQNWLRKECEKWSWRNSNPWPPKGFQDSNEDPLISAVSVVNFVKTIKLNCFCFKSGKWFQNTLNLKKTFRCVSMKIRFYKRKFFNLGMHDRSFNLILVLVFPLEVLQKCLNQKF